MKLAEIHQAFVSGIYKLETSLSPASFIKAGEKLNPEQCLDIYRGSVYGNLCSALADIYPAFVQCVGDDFFQALALRYVKKHPSRSASLDHYGAEFSNFVSTFEPLKSLPYVEDLAKLEWQWHLAFHAKDELALDPASLNTVPEEAYDELIFDLSLSASLLKSQFPIREIWQHCLRDKDPKADEQEIALDAGEQRVLVWRTVGYEIRVDLLSVIEFDLLSLVNKKKTLGTILVELQSKYSQEEINQTLARSVQQGWFTGFSLAE